MLIYISSLNTVLIIKYVKKTQRYKLLNELNLDLVFSLKKTESCLKEWPGYFNLMKNNIYKVFNKNAWVETVSKN